MRALDPVREIAAIIERLDNPETACARTRAVLRNQKDLCAMYVGTANSLPVLKAIEDAGRGGKILVVTTDLFPALVPLIRSGRSLATIHQQTQPPGVSGPVQYLLEGKRPLPTIKVPPHIVMMSNLERFAGRPHAGAAGSITY